LNPTFVISIGERRDYKFLEKKMQSITDNVSRASIHRHKFKVSEVTKESSQKSIES